MLAGPVLDASGRRGRLFCDESESASRLFPAGHSSQKRVGALVFLNFSFLAASGESR
jgi:hypothetical protein